jgi:hypothetical protein
LTCVLAIVALAILASAAAGEDEGEMGATVLCALILAAFVWALWFHPLALALMVGASLTLHALAWLSDR